MRRTDVSLALLLAFAWLAAGCEPASVTEAKTQLRRGGSRITRLSIPIAQDTFTVGEFLSCTAGQTGSSCPKDTVTTTNGVLGLKFAANSLTVDVGNKLQFSNLAFDPFAFSFNQMLQTTQQGPVAISFPAPPAAAAAFPISVPPPTRFTTPAGSSVVSATAGSGYIVRSMTNTNTNCSATVSISLTDSLGNTVASFPGVAVNNNATVVDSISAAGITVSGYAQVGGNASFGACVPNPAGSVAASITFRPMTLTAVGLKNVNEGFSQSYSPLQTDMQGVDSVSIFSGSFSLTLQNRLPIADTLTVRLNGVTKAGAAVTGTLAVPAASGNGAYTSGTLTFDLAGAKIVPPSVVAQVTGTAKTAAGVIATITPTNASNAALVNGGGSLVIQAIWGTLDPVKLPKLAASVVNSQEMPSASINFGDLKDAVQSSTLNNATATLTVLNSSQTPVTLTAFQMGAVQLTAAGQLTRDGLGNLVYEKDGSGNPILVTVESTPGAGRFSVARAGTSTVALAAAPLLDKIAHLLINNTRVAVVTSGTVSVGDGTKSSITRTDSVKVRFQLVIGLDLTIPVAGVVFKRNQATDGLDLNQADGDELATRLVLATAGARVTNGTPFGVTVNLALAKDSLGSAVDIFGLPACATTVTSGCRVALDSVVLRAPTVGPTGLVTTPSTDSVAVSISGTNARVLFGKKFTAGVRIRLVPSPTGAGRGAIRATDKVVVNAKAAVDVKVGGTE